MAHVYDRRYETGGFEANPDVLWDGLGAATFLRDDLLRDGGIAFGQ